MSTGLVARPAPSNEIERSGVRGRLRGLRRTSPGRLQLILAALLAAGLLTGLVAALAASSAASGTDDLGGRAQPLLVEAETIYSALADADTTAAQAFLAGGLEPADLTKRYNEDLERAATALTSAARRTPQGSEAAVSIEALSAGLGRYSALVATARADNRQGLPLGASYLSAASQLNRDTLLPEAESLFTQAQAEVDDGFGAARTAGWVTLYVLLLLVLLGVLIWAQRYLSRHTRRTFNVPLLAATGLTVLLALLSGGVLINQNVHLSKASHDGANPVAWLAQARILALQARGDEALTLAARGSSSQEADYNQVMSRLTMDRGPLANSYGSLDPDLGRLTDQALQDVKAYDAQHKKVRALDENGDYEGAVKLAIGKPTTDVFERARKNIDTALEDRKEVFTSEITSARTGLTVLAVLGPLFALAICAFAAAGIRARLEEYR